MFKTKLFNLKKKKKKRSLTSFVTGDERWQNSRFRNLLRTNFFSSSPLKRRKKEKSL